MKAYELLFFVNPAIDEESRLAANKRIENVITADGGTIDKADNWGKRKLAYEINGLTDGDYTLVDFHAEATSEKLGLGHYLDGRVSAVVGTHTHVQTADEQLMPKGTAFISDAGMTGAHGGVLGVTAESVMPRFLTGLPAKFEPCEALPAFNGVVIDIDDATGLAQSIKRVFLNVETLT